jgi:hypothetical protein
MTYPIVAIRSRGIWLYFRRPGVTAPDPSWPWLAGAGTLREQARASHLGTLSEGETPHMTVTLDNSRRQASGLLGLPLRAPAQLLDESGAVLFDGLTTSVKFGPQLILEIDA